MKLFIVAALALVAAADRPQPSYAPAPAYRPRPTYAPTPAYRSRPTHAPATTYKPQPTYTPAPTYAPAPTYKPQPSYAPAPAYKPKPKPSYSSYKPIAILEEENVHPGDGTYNFHFSTENDIYRSESGVPLPGYGKNEYGQEQGSYKQEGSWSYTNGYGEDVKVTFVADENGYHPSSDILPTPVPTEYPTPKVSYDQSYQQPAYGKY